MECQDANICANASTNVRIKNIFLFFTIFAQNSILPQNSKVLMYLDFSIAYMFCNVMMYQGTNLCANASTNIDTNYIFQFLTIFA